MLHRGTGKTTSLIKLAHNYKLPIISDKIYKTFLTNRAKELELSIMIIDDLSCLSLAQYKNTKTVLVDENINSRFISDKFNIVGFAKKAISV